MNWSPTPAGSDTGVYRRAERYITVWTTKPLTNGKEVFPLILKSSKLSGNLQSSHTYNFGLRVYGLAGVVHTGASQSSAAMKSYNVNNCQHHHYLITQMNFKSVYPEAKILHFPRKQKSSLQRERVFPCKTRGKSHLLIGSLSSSLFLGRANLPWCTHRSTNVPRYKVLIHRKQKKPKPKGASPSKEAGSWSFPMFHFKIFEYHISTTIVHKYIYRKKNL